MTTQETLKEMVMQFKVAELQSILVFAGYRNVKFRKKDLQKKVLRLISKKKVPRRAAKKIRAIRTQENDVHKNDNYHYSNNIDDCFSFNRNEHVKNLICDTYYDNYNNSIHPTNYNNVSDTFLSMFKHMDMQRLTNVRFKTLSCFEYLSDISLVKPLIPNQHEDDTFQFHLSFTLNSDIKNLLFCDNEKKSPYQVLLRMCLLNDEIEVNDSLPPKLYIILNCQFCSLPPCISTNKTQNSSIKSNDLPINITPYIQMNSVNALTINWAANYSILYGTVIQLVRKFDAEELITRLKDKGERDPEISKKFIYNNLNDHDVEIAATSLKMSLICPLGKMLMSLPSRGTTCNHLQCFDGCIYIKMNEIKSTWQCPVCNQTCLYENLFIDGYFMDILKSDKFTPSITNVQLNADGSWECVPHEEGSIQIANHPHQVLDKESFIAEKIDKDIEEKSSESNYGLPPLLNDSIVEDLKSFFFQYENSNTANPLSAFSKYDSTEKSIFDIKSMKNPELPSSLSSNSNQDYHVDKKNVPLIDLTESDSESDEIHSISSFSDNSHNSFICMKDDFYNISSPPVYDIDSDSS
ncbi:hypothetical protein PGB90_000430 [Kerria lacca]